MYYVTIGDINGNDEILYYPSDEQSSIYDTQLKQSVGECGEFTFKVPFNNAFYNLIAEYKVVTIIRDDAEYWRGYIKEITTDFDNSLEVYCIEDLGWLNYEFPASPEQKEITKLQQFQNLLNRYNGLIGVKGTKKTFDIGYITIPSAQDKWNYTTTYEMSTLDCLRLIAGDKGYVRVRRQNGKRYIDIVTLEDYGNQTDQAIQFGDNLLDYTKELNTSYMLNVIYPYGKELEDNELYKDYKQRLAGTPLEDAASIAKYGRIAKNIFFETDDLKTLNSQAATYLKQNARPRTTIDLTAVDMSELGLSYSKLKLGDKLEIIAEPFGFSGGDFITVVQMTTDIQDLSKNNLTLSDNKIGNRTLTQIQSEIVDILDDVPTESTILSAARKNAIELLNNSEGGFVSFEFDEKNPTQMIAIHVADNKDLDKALNDWVWNKGGFGYRTRKNANDAWSNLAVAITMDGAIVANAITSGVMSGDRVRGGVIEVGGKGFGKNGQILVKNEDGTTLITLNKDGMTLSGGQIIEWSSIKKKVKDKNVDIDVTDLTDTKGKLWSTQIGETWIKTTTVKAQNLITSLIYKDKDNYLNFGEEKRKIDGAKKTLKHRLHVKSSEDDYTTYIDTEGRLVTQRFYAGKSDEDSDAALIDEAGVSQHGQQLKWSDIKKMNDIIYKHGYILQLDQLDQWARSMGYRPT